MCVCVCVHVHVCVHVYVMCETIKASFVGRQLQMDCIVLHTCPEDTDIWKRCGISLTLVGSRDRPDTKRRNKTLSSVVNDSSVCHSHWTTWFS